MSKWSIELFKENLAVVAFNYKKKEPLIMVGAGIAGFLVTSYLAYRAKDKINDIVEEIEYRRENNLEVPVAETVVKVGKALAPAIVVGGLSTAAILRSYHVLTGRNALLASALATATQANHRLRKQIRERYPDDPNAAFLGKHGEALTAPQEGKEQENVKTVTPSNIQWMEYASFDKSEEFAKDDLNYCQMFIAAMDNALSEKLRRQGFLTLTMVYDALKIPLEATQRRIGTELGWTDNDFFSLDTHVVMVKDKNGYAYPVPIVEFEPVRDITSSVNFASDIHEYFM